jgi:hypothetical protein
MMISKKEIKKKDVGGREVLFTFHSVSLSLCVPLYPLFQPARNE